MRYSRWLILAAIASILAFVWDTYSSRKQTLAKDTPAAPAPLQSGLDGQHNTWNHTELDGDRPIYTIRASHAKQIREPSVMELEQVELQLYHKDATEFDLIKTDKAEFDVAGKTLYSDGQVDISMGVPVEGPQHGRLLKIHTSGVHFDKASGKATTDRPSTFEFDQGNGSATGADYDPNTRELHMHSQVALDWRGKTPESKPMHAEAGEAIYRERESKVVLSPWSKLTRDALHLDAAVSVVLLEDGEIKHAQVLSAKGVQDDPGRKVEFGADRMDLNFADAMVISNIEGEHNSRLVSTTDSGRTTVTSDHLDLNFLVSGKESTLETASASGNSVAESVPISKPGATAADTRVLKSDTIHLKMRAGGKEMDSAETAGPGTLDLVPNHPGQPKRFLKGDQIWIAYGAENKIQSFRSTNVSTRTDKPPLPGQPVPPPALTESKDIFATFDPVSGDLAHVEQKTDFRYQEGDRQARSNLATLDQQKDLMTLDGRARAWDPTGSVDADRIVMNQKTGDYTADGNVTSIREPNKKGKSSSLLSNDEIMQAHSQKMVSTGRSPNQKVHYEGNAIAQQGANRIRADRLDLDNERHMMEAHGSVVSEFVDKAKGGDAQATAKSSKSVFTKVRSKDLLYTEDTRIAVYQGGVDLNRPGLSVNSRELTAYLKDSNSDSDSSLDKALADGAVKIVSTTVKPGTPTRTRTSTGEHGEYYADEGKVTISGGQPLMVDTLRDDDARGKQLTWWEKNDRLLVDGSEAAPARSTLHKGKK
jgi:lipopolysaccharide export system protein LptA